MGDEEYWSLSYLLLVLGAVLTGDWFFLILAVGILVFSKRAVIWRRVSTMKRDIHLTWAMGKVMGYGKVWEIIGWSVPSVFVRGASRHPERTAIIDVYRTWTYKELDEFSNRVGRYFADKGYEKGDCVALMMEGKGEYVGTWLGLAKIGVVTALVNTNQRKETLKHSLDIVKAKGFIFGTEYAQAVEEILEDFPDLDLYGYGDGDKPGTCVDLKFGLNSVSPDPLDSLVKKRTMRDKMLYIYTSGTTGLPKAAIITNARAMFMSYGVKSIIGITEEDILYTPLPLYHSAGGLVGAGQLVFAGCTVVVRNKFSASNFWSDCIKYNCTLSQYIGETCRYLLSVKPSENDRKHKVRAMFGNGLRPQIWKEFVDRFGVKLIGEFYGATEGNANLMNVWNRVGAVGYLPWFVRMLYPVTLIRVDPQTNEPLRGPDGFCIICKTGEPGILVGNIDKKKIVKSFHGYADKDETRKKILFDVLKKGDMYFNTGDILVEDEYNYFYFKDRTGDTFRWRGENISTSEVEAVISNIVGLKDAIVYGVEIPNVEGKAGMAAILDEEGVLDLKKLEDGCRKSLQPVARPLFIRILRKLPITGTFKLQKFDLQKEGYDVTKVTDPVYFLDPRTQSYQPLTTELHHNIITNAIRL